MPDLAGKTTDHWVKDSLTPICMGAVSASTSTNHEQSDIRNHVPMPLAVSCLRTAVPSTVRAVWHCECTAK